MALAWAILVCLTAIQFVGGGNAQAGATDQDTDAAVNSAISAFH